MEESHDLGRSKPAGVPATEATLRDLSGSHIYGREISMIRLPEKP
jgi:hypothetical protein